MTWQSAIIAAAGVVAIATIVGMVAPQWPRIWRLARGHQEPPMDRWRRVHIEGDRRRPIVDRRPSTPRDAAAPASRTVRR